MTTETAGAFLWNLDTSVTGKIYDMYLSFFYLLTNDMLIAFSFTHTFSFLAFSITQLDQR